MIMVLIELLNLLQKINSDLILNVQGDEPFIDKSSLEKLISVFIDDDKKNIDLASIMQLITNEREILSPNNVKVVVDKNNFAIYFSRSIIPFSTVDLKDKNIKYFKHIGVYAFRKESLLYYYKSKSTKLEKLEKLEQLRF